MRHYLLTLAVRQARGLLCLLLLICILLPGATPAEAVASPPPGLAAEKSAALELLQQRRFSEAYAAYMALLRQQPDDFEVNLMLARSARLAGKPNHSRVAYERVIEARPEEAGLYLELADLLVQLGANEEARKNLGQARLLDPDLDESQLSPIARGVDERTSNFSKIGRLGGGLIYDSNINAAPDRRGVNLGGVPLNLDSKNTAEEALGMFLNASLDLAWRPNLESDWWLVADVSGYQRWNFEASPRRDITYGRGALGVRHFTGGHLFEVRGKAETILENEDTSLNIFGGEVNWVAALSPNLHNVFRAGLEYREDCQVSEREGAYYYASEHLRWFFGASGHSLTGGLKVYGADARTARFRYTGYEPSMNAHFILPADFSLNLGLAWRLEEYKDSATVLESRNRRDEQWRLTAFVDKKVTESLTLYAGWQYVDNWSESDIYKYEQHQLMTGVQFTF